MGEKMRKRAVLVFVLAAIAAALSACGGGSSAKLSTGSSGSGSNQVNLTLSPLTAKVAINGTVKLTANTPVTWSVNDIAGGNSTVGTIVGAADNTATYTAPNFIPSKATVTIKATTTSSPQQTLTAQITVGMVIWTKEYPISSGGESLWSVTTLSDGTIVAGGDEGNIQEVAVAISYDSDGNRLWSKIYDGYAFFGSVIARSAGIDFSSITVTPDLGAIESGPIIVTTDKSGNQSGTSKCSGNYLVQAADPESSSTGVFAGFNKLSVVIFPDNNGSLDCANAVAVPDLKDEGARVLSIVSTPDGYILAGDYSGGVATNTGSFVLDTDKSGSKVWRKNFPDVDQGRALEITDQNGGRSVYFTGRDLSDVSTGTEKFLTARLDMTGTMWTGWPIKWDGDNPATGVLVNFPTVIVPDKSTVGGVIVVGFSTKLGSTDVNATDTVAIAYKPDASVYWKWRGALSTGSSEQILAGTLDPNNNLILAGFGKGQSLVAKITLPK